MNISKIKEVSEKIRKLCSEHNLNDRGIIQVLIPLVFSISHDIYETGEPFDEDISLGNVIAMMKMSEEFLIERGMSAVKIREIIKASRKEQEREYNVKA